MGNGYSKDNHTNKFERRNSKRNSKKKERMEIQESDRPDQAKLKDKCLKDIGAILAQLVDKLKVDDKTEEIQSLLKTIEGEEHKTKGNSDDTNGEVTVMEILKRTKVVLGEFQEFPKRLKDSLEGVTNDIYTRVAENLQENHQLINRKTSIRRKNSRTGETKHKTGVSVQIFYSPEGIMNDIQKVLQTTLRSELKSVNFIPVSDTSKIDDHMLLIVTCNVTTRAHSDAERIIKYIKRPANAVFVLMHVGETHTLSKTNDAVHLKGKNEYQNLRGIYDMFYVKSNNDFKRCDRNESSIKELCSFCKEHPYSANIESTHL